MNKVFFSQYFIKIDKIYLITSLKKRSIQNISKLPMPYYLYFYVFYI